MALTEPAASTRKWLAQNAELSDKLRAELKAQGVRVPRTIHSKAYRLAAVPRKADTEAYFAEAGREGAHG